MAQSDAATPEAYLAELPPDRRDVVEAVRRTILDHLPDGFVEGMEFGMLSYHIPLENHPDTYNGRPLGIIALANQKNHVSLYLMGVYGDEDEKAWFTEAWRDTGIKLDMGKSCVRFRTLEGIPLDVVGQAVSRVSAADLIRIHDNARS